MDQCRHLQQQMLEEFQRSVLAVFRMIGSLHQHQQGVLEERVQRVEHLSQALDALQARPETVREPWFSGGCANGAEASAAPSVGGLATPSPSLCVHDEPSRGLADERTYAWIYQRMDALQREKQGGWNQLLKSLRLQ
jgi:hypothetical protein